jgi:Lrp/AsnC family transcriptional regulator, regulator for asnA, asnC and gidA
MVGRINYESLEKSVKLDVKDKRILSLLSDDARTPLTRIAKKVQLSRDAVDYRIKKLQEKGIILQFFPNLNYDKLGYYIFHVFMLIDELDKGEQDKLVNHLKKHPNTISIIEYSDRWDLEMVLIAKNLLEFDKIISDIAEKFPNIIMEKDKLEIIRRYNSSYVPPLIREQGHEKEKIVHEKAIPAKVDEIDLKILRILSLDCRVSTYEIGKQIKLSADAVSYRIKNLLKEKVIRNFTILVNLSLMKYHWYTFSVEMKMFNYQNEKKFEAFLDQNHNILRSVKTLGGWDLLLYLVVENPREFHKIVKDMKNTFSNIVRNYQTWVAYKEHIFKTMPEIIK